MTIPGYLPYYAVLAAFYRSRLSCSDRERPWPRLIGRHIGAAGLSHHGSRARRLARRTSYWRARAIRAPRTAFPPSNSQYSCPSLVGVLCIGAPRPEASRRARPQHGWWASSSTASSGAIFVVLYAAGSLPALFALPAGPRSGRSGCCGRVVALRMRAAPATGRAPC